MHQEPLVPLSRHATPNCLILAIELRDATSRRQQHFAKRLRREARAIGLLVSHKFGLCVFYGAERICSNWHRHRMLAWLSDQPEVCKVDLAPLHNLKALVDGRLPSFDPDVTPAQRRAAGALVRRVALGAATQWLRFVEGRLG